ncbi:MAG: hypothetical protein IPN84_18020 [Sphingomonadales bacterium]|jgi:hypothetical protein|nr:hypothetical protein [Sphingomonadales bacterium]
MAGITEWELWACAQQVLTQHQNGADDFVAERIASLQNAGDTNGIATWFAIAERLKQLRRSSSRDESVQ